MSEDYDSYPVDELTPEQRDEIRARIQELLSPESVAELRKVTDRYMRAVRRRERRRAVIKYAFIGVTIIILGWLILFA